MAKAEQVPAGPDGEELPGAVSVVLAKGALGCADAMPLEAGAVPLGAEFMLPGAEIMLLLADTTLLEAEAASPNAGIVPVGLTVAVPVPTQYSSPA